MSSRAAGVLTSALLGLVLAACSSPSPAAPEPTGSTCPPGSTLSYENFGQPFMETFCTRCHASDLHGSDRHGAPLYHDFDSLMGVLVVGDHVDEYAAAGPDAVNELMPPDGAIPTLAERTQLGEWVACEIERINDPVDAGVDAGVDAASAADASAADAAP